MRFKLFSVFVVAGFVIAGCNSNNKTEQSSDSIIQVDSVLRVDSIVVDTTPVRDTAIMNPM